jgi:hypothetical protein
MGADLFLDDDALRKLTGCAQKAKQVAQLRRMGIPFWINARGQAVVACSAATAWADARAAHVAQRCAEADRLIEEYQRRAAIEAGIRQRADARRAAGAEARAEAAARRPALVRHHTATRRAAKLRRTPPWADLVAIEAVYAEARRLTAETGVQHDVDHDVPLQGLLVSGLHVPANLKILTGSENSRKRNRFEVCDG